MTSPGDPAATVEESRPRFAVDVMLGRLARWLRIVGWDTLYDNHFEDEELVRVAVEEDRLLLTRDRKLILRKPARDRSLLIESDTPWEQLLQVIGDLQLEVRGSRILSRCLVCNETLQNTRPADLLERVPPYVLSTRRTFRCCPSCKRVYWRGTHRQRVVAILQRLRILSG